MNITKATHTALFFMDVQLLLDSRTPANRSWPVSSTIGAVNFARRSKISSLSKNSGHSETNLSESNDPNLIHAGVTLGSQGRINSVEIR